MGILLNEIDVVILCGGMGTRIRAEIGQKQKTMAEVDGRPFLDILLGYLSEQGFSRIILCTGFQADEIENYYRENNLDLQIELSREVHPLGTGGAIKNAQQLVKGPRFIAMNGDCFCEIDYKGFVDFHLKNNALASLVVSSAPDGGDFGSICIDGEGKITSFEEKSKVPSAFLSAGIYCFNRDIFSIMPGKDNFSIETEFFPTLLDKRFYGFKVPNVFIDIGTPSRYKEAQKRFRKAGQ